MLYAIGTIVDKPRPTRKNPDIALYSNGNNTASSTPVVASIPPSTIIFLSPRVARALSPKILPIVIELANAASAIGARVLLLFTMSSM
jgi:hypothetical protein